MSPFSAASFRILLQAMDEKPTLAEIPSVDRLLASAWARTLIERHSRAFVVEAMRRACEELRAEIRAGRLGAGSIAAEIERRTKSEIARSERALPREVVVSRGELIEIGGSFRIPEVMAKSGAKLREVGTTNRTHAKDYAEAIGTQTGALLKVHTSNYRVVGFTAEVPLGELVALGREH